VQSWLGRLHRHRHRHCHSHRHCFSQRHRHTHRPRRRRKPPLAPPQAPLRPPLAVRAAPGRAAERAAAAAAGASPRGASQGPSPWALRRASLPRCAMRPPRPTPLALKAALMKLSTGGDPAELSRRGRTPGPPSAQVPGSGIHRWPEDQCPYVGAAGKGEEEGVGEGAGAGQGAGGNHFFSSDWKGELGGDPFYTALYCPTGSSFCECIE